MTWSLDHPDPLLSDDGERVPVHVDLQVGPLPLQPFDLPHHLTEGQSACTDVDEDLDGNHILTF